MSRNGWRQLIGALHFHTSYRSWAELIPDQLLYESFQGGPVLDQAVSRASAFASPIQVEPVVGVDEGWSGVLLDVCGFHPLGDFVARRRQVTDWRRSGDGFQNVHAAFQASDFFTCETRRRLAGKPVQITLTDPCDGEVFPSYPKQ